MRNDDFIPGLVAGLLVGCIVTWFCLGFYIKSLERVHLNILLKNGLVEGKHGIDGKTYYSYTTNFVKP